MYTYWDSGSRRRVTKPVQGAAWRQYEWHAVWQGILRLSQLAPAGRLRVLLLDARVQEDEVRAVILRGAGDEAFCSGFDIGSLPTQSKADKDQRLKSLDEVESLFQCLIHFPYPVIAMLNGFAFGLGCELAMCCDIRIGAEDIRMGMPPAKLGMVYPWLG